MTDIERNRLRSIKSFSQLVKYLKDDLEWPIETEDFEELTYDYDPEELGIDPKNAVKIEEIQQLRPLVTNQPWGIFFVKFGKNRLSVVALRRILSQLVIKKRASMRKADQPSWHLHDLLFISNFCEDNERKITFARFTQNEETNDLPTLKVLGWDEGDTALYMDHVQRELKDKLRWPKDQRDTNAWRDQWSSAFTLRHREVITTSKDLAVHLADLAKKIRDRALKIIAIESEKGPLRKLHKAFREALIHDLSEEGFSDMYAQTISYGLLTARVSRPMGIIADNMADMVPITNPFLKEMLSVFLTIGGRKSGIDFDELGVQDVVDLLNRTNMEAVLRDFGNRTQREDPVIHFYQDFLQEYDRQKRVERGVFYTPQPVVSYIVRSVHELLQTEFGLEDGLASTITWGEMIRKNPNIKLPLLQIKKETDPNSMDVPLSPDDPFVTILDPTTGTATFLVEVIDIIHKTMTAKWEGQGLKQPQISQNWNEYVPAHLLPRLYGFELMMAPYAIAHMKIGLKLHETGYKFASEERVQVYLTNSLEPASDAEQVNVIIYSEALAHEAGSVNEIKKDKRFTILIGNPPYLGESSNKGIWISNLLNDYYFVDGIPLGEKNPKWLQDDYVKFIRFSQYQIQHSGIGIMGLITNHGFIDNPTFRGLRRNLISLFSKMYIFDLHGNTKKKEKSPDGSKDENIFDIQQGVAISIFVDNLGISCTKLKSIYQSQLWGLREKKYNILGSQNLIGTLWNVLYPEKPFYLFIPQNLGLFEEYKSYWKIDDIFQNFSVGIVTARDKLTISLSKKEIWDKINQFKKLPIESARKIYDLGDDGQDWKVSLAQKDVLNSGPRIEKVVPILYRPFDKRWTYYTGVSSGFIGRPRPEVMYHMLANNNLSLTFHKREELIIPYSHFLVTDCITEHGLLSSKTTNYQAPLFLYAKRNFPLSLSKQKQTKSNNKEISNFSPNFLKEFALRLNLKILPNELSDLVNTCGIKNIFYYIYAIFYSFNYRKRYAEFLRMDFPRLPLTKSLDLFHSLESLGAELVALHLMESPKLNKPITKFTGNPRGEIEKITYSDNTVWIDNARTEGFCDVPENVWNFHIGGYQVCEKWLKYRKGLQLSAEDIAHYQKIVVALNETIRIMGEIDAVIEKHGGWPGAFDTSSAGSEMGAKDGAQQTLFSGGEVQE